MRRKPSILEEKAEKQKTETVKTAGSLSAEGIVKALAGIKLDIASSIDKIEENLLKEFQKLRNLQEALIAALNTRTDTAGLQVQTIALKALESASALRHREHGNESKKEGAVGD